MRVSLIVILLLNLSSALLGVQKAKTAKPIPGPKIESFEPSAKLLMTCGRNGVEMFCTKNRRTTVTLEVKVQDLPNEKLTYTYSTTAGEIIGDGPRVTWDLHDPGEGVPRKATVTVRNSQGGESTASTTVDVVACPSCFYPDQLCPTFVVNSYDKDAHRAEQVGFEVKMSGEFSERPDYVWTVSGGKILKGQHTPRIQVLVTGGIDSEVTATVKLSGFDASCTGTTASHSISIQP